MEGSLQQVTFNKGRCVLLFEKPRAFWAKIEHFEKDRDWQNETWKMKQIKKSDSIFKVIPQKMPDKIRDWTKDYPALLEPESTLSLCAFCLTIAPSDDCWRDPTRELGPNILAPYQIERWRPLYPRWPMPNGTLPLWNPGTSAMPHS